MKKINSLLFALLGILLLTACDNQGLKKTKSGLLYKIISDGKNPIVKKGQFIKLSFSQKVRDSVLFSSDSSLPAYVRIDSVPSGAYSPIEIFSMLSKGDSAVIIQLGDSIRRKSGQPLPPFIHNKDKIILTMKVKDVFDNEELVRKDREFLMDAFHAKEIRQVENYLQQHNIKTTKTVQGTFVEIKNPGEGVQADSGKQVSVIYTGKLIPSGKVFDTNDEGGKQPIKFIIGRHSVIPGMEYGVTGLKKGGVATLYIPAYLAYDEQPGPGHTPNENIYFDVKIVDVTEAPAESDMSTQPGTSARPDTRQQAPAPAHK